MTRTRLHRAAAVAAVTAALVGVGSASPASAALVARTSTLGPCPLTRSGGESVQSYAKQVIGCTAARWTVPGGAARAICIARRESGLDPAAKSSGGGYLGLFQHSASYWPTRFREWTSPAWQLSPSALNARSNTIVTIRAVHAVNSWRGAGWGVNGC
jgi:hypothetical protein